MRNSEVYAYIERLYDAVMSVSDAVRLGVPEDEAVDEVICVIKDLEEEVRKEMEAEEKQKSGLESTPFFSELAESDDENLINFCERMDEVHPELGEFMEYLMCCDDPSFLVSYGDKHVYTIGHCSGKWLYLTCQKLCLKLFGIGEGGNSDDK